MQDCRCRNVLVGRAGRGWRSLLLYCAQGRPGNGRAADTGTLVFTEPGERVSVACRSTPEKNSVVAWIRYVVVGRRSCDVVHLLT